MRRIQPEAVPLLVVALLAPVIGGHVATDPRPLSEGLLAGVLGGPELPLVTRALLGTLVALSLGWALLRRKVVSIPTLPLGAGVFLLVGWLGTSVLWSAFPYASYASWGLWVVYGLSLFATVATVGRRTGVRILLWATVAGGTVTALKAIQEYGMNRAQDPGWRVFGGWNNPNALAGILAVVMVLALGLSLAGRRLEAVLAGASAALCGFALYLTGSKGGILCALLGVIAVLASGLASKLGWRTLRALLPVAAAGAMVWATLSTTPQGLATSRVAQATSTQEQSAGFRTLLWRGALDLTQERPLTGFGVGTYRFESARPGLNEQTVHAHQTWLQLAAEGGVPALLMLLGVCALWCRSFLRGHRKFPDDLAAIRAGLVGAVAVSAANGFVESHLIYLGTGLTTFLLLGAGLQLSHDGSTPEWSPKTLRRVLVATGCGVTVLVLWHVAAGEWLKAQSVTALAGGSADLARSNAGAALALAGQDADAQALIARLETDPQARLASLDKAATLAPSVKHLRTLARQEAAMGDVNGALTTLSRALERDPNNLACLELRYQLFAQTGDDESAIRTAESLIAVEQTPYMKVRAIPELVPIETYDARVWLAAKTTDVSREAELLSGAVDGYRRYFERTVPLVRQLERATGDASYFGHDMNEAARVAEQAKLAIQRLKALQGSSPSVPSVEDLDRLSSTFTIGPD